MCLLYILYCYSVQIRKSGAKVHYNLAVSNPQLNCLRQRWRTIPDNNLSHYTVGMVPPVTGPAWLMGAGIVIIPTGTELVKEVLHTLYLLAPRWDWKKKPWVRCHASTSSGIGCKEHRARSTKKIKQQQKQIQNRWLHHFIFSFLMRKLNPPLCL